MSNFRLLCLSLVIAASSLCGPVSANTSQNFTDPLSAGNDAGFLVINGVRYTREAAGLRRTFSSSGIHNGTDRVMNTTQLAAPFIDRDFVVDLDIRRPDISSGGDIIFFGLGDGSVDSIYNNEPTNSIHFRIHTETLATWVDATARIGNVFHAFQRIADDWDEVTGATFRMKRSDDLVTLSIPSIPGASHTISIAATLGSSLTAANTLIFFGNTSEGTVFSNFNLVSTVIGNDDDEDGYSDVDDNCTNDYNPDQSDSDGNGIGDVCDTGADGDADGVADVDDNCPVNANSDQADGDGDGTGDVCDSDPNDGPLGDADGDGVDNTSDACPGFDDTVDTDGDGQADGCDADNSDGPLGDADGDGVNNSDDACPGADDNIDVDGDGIADGCDPDNNDGPLGDADGDGVNNAGDACPATSDGIVNGNGCAVVDLCDCNAGNHGDYVSCITRNANDFRREGLITKKEKKALVKAAAKSSCGKSDKSKKSKKSDKSKKSKKSDKSKKSKKSDKSKKSGKSGKSKKSDKG